MLKQASTRQQGSAIAGNFTNERHLFKIPRYLAVVACEPFKQRPLFQIRRRTGYQIAFYGFTEQLFNSGLEVLHGQVPPVQYGRYYQKPPSFPI
jgi:hypothetical protein